MPSPGEISGFEGMSDPSAGRKPCWTSTPGRKSRRSCRYFQIGSARRFNAQINLKYGEASAFCMYFDGLVVIEFSEVGNAAYVYTHSDFERYIAAGLRRPNDVGDRKRKGARRELAPRLGLGNEV